MSTETFHLILPAGFILVVAVMLYFVFEGPTIKLPPSILRYWLAMNATAFDSSVSSVVMFCGAAGMHQATAELGYNIAAFNLQQLALLFMGSFGWAILQYLHSHPVVELLAHEDVLDRLNAELADDSIKKQGSGGHATGDVPAEPTAAPDHSVGHTDMVPPPQCPR